MNSRRINRRLFVQSVAAAVAGATLASCARATRSEQARRPPNVVMLISDDQAWTDYGFMGHPVIKTPNLDRLAKESVLFTRGYVTAPVCCPSLGSMITGLYPHQNKITSNDPPREAIQDKPRWQALREEMVGHIDKVPTLPRTLREKGYVSFQSGKWWQGHYSRGGFTSGMTHGDPARFGRHGDEGLRIGRETMQPVFDFIDGAGDAPFFVWFAPMLPHAPHTPPERLLAKYADKTDSIHVAGYWAMCEWWDEVCGELLGYLDKKGLSEDTLVLYVCDNGWIQDPKTANRHNQRSKMSPYDGGIRSPIMVRWPSHMKPRRDDTTLVSSVDLAPTVLAACGLEPTPQMQGLNLLDARRLARREAIFSAMYTHNAVDVDSPVANLQCLCVVEGDWKLILASKSTMWDMTAPQLYNVVEDPHEARDVAAQNPDRVKHLRALLRGWWPEGEAACADA